MPGRACRTARSPRGTPGPPHGAGTHRRHGTPPAAPAGDGVGGTQPLRGDPPCWGRRRRRAPHPLPSLRGPLARSLPSPAGARRGRSAAPAPGPPLPSAARRARPAAMLARRPLTLRPGLPSPTPSPGRSPKAPGGGGGPAAAGERGYRGRDSSPPRSVCLRRRGDSRARPGWERAA